MFEILTLVVFIWLMVKSVGLAFRLTWGMAKIIASILLVFALPVLMVCILFVGGLALIAPVIMAGLACGILKACV